MRSKSQESSSDIENDTVQENIAKLEELCEKHLENEIENMNITVRASKNQSAVDAINSIVTKKISLY